MEHDFRHIFSLESNNINPKKGRVLISEPFAVDDIFKRSVILLADYSEHKGAFGFILNKFLEKNQINKKLLEEFDGIELNFSIGGPVEIESMFYIHTLSPDVLEGSTEIISGVYLGGDYEKLKYLIKNGNISSDKIRFFAGYSGWAPGQLENEIKNNFWLVKTSSKEEILSPDINMWVNQIKQLDDKYQIWTKVPDDPSLN